MTKLAIASCAAASAVGCLAENWRACAFFLVAALYLWKGKGPE